MSQEEAAEQLDEIVNLDPMNDADLDDDSESDEEDQVEKDGIWTDPVRTSKSQKRQAPGPPLFGPPVGHIAFRNLDASMRLWNNVKDIPILSREYKVSAFAPSTYGTVTVNMHVGLWVAHINLSKSFWEARRSFLFKPSLQSRSINKRAELVLVVQAAVLAGFRENEIAMVCL